MTHYSKKFVEAAAALSIFHPFNAAAARNQWLRLCKAHHPDNAHESNKESQTQKTQVINAAYDVIKEFFTGNADQIVDLTHHYRDSNAVESVVLDNSHLLYKHVHNIQLAANSVAQGFIDVFLSRAWVLWYWNESILIEKSQVKANNATRKASELYANDSYSFLMFIKPEHWQNAAAIHAKLIDLKLPHLMYDSQVGCQWLTSFKAWGFILYGKYRNFKNFNTTNKKRKVNAESTQNEAIEATKALVKQSKAA